MTECQISINFWIFMLFKHIDCYSRKVVYNPFDTIKSCRIMTSFYSSCCMWLCTYANWVWPCWLLQHISRNFDRYYQYEYWTPITQNNNPSYQHFVTNWLNVHATIWPFASMHWYELMLCRSRSYWPITTNHVYSYIHVDS